jgi:peptidoglycan/LPS O-acetylase OafA/YrhL
MTPSHRIYYRSLDGIRGWAILLVVFFHNFGFVKYFGFGWLGVDLFFVLSGFLISNILLNTLNQRNYLKNFYIKRILRIFPLYYSVLIFVLFIFPYFSSIRENLEFYRDNQWWFWLYLQNWLFILKPLEKTNLLIHFWSLAVEEQFYLLWPFIILLIRKEKNLLALLSFLLAFIIFARIVIWQHHIGQLSYFSFYTFTRIDGILIGCMLALIIKMNKDFLRQYSSLIVFILAILNFVFFFLNKANAFSFPFFPFIGYTTFAIIFALLVYEAIIGKTYVVNKIFSNEILVFFGRISFGFYIFHWPVYIALNPKLLSFLNNELSLKLSACQFLSSIICTLIGLGISVISYYYFEMKFLKLKTGFN